MKENNNAYAYISIVAIVAIVATLVMFAGSNRGVTQTPSIGGDVLGDAKRVVESNRNIDYIGGIEGQNLFQVQVQGQTEILLYNKCSVCNCDDVLPEGYTFGWLLGEIAHLASNGKCYCVGYDSDGEAQGFNPNCPE